MLHSKTRTTYIWTNKPVYRDFCVGNLVKPRVGETLRCPLQHRFYSDSKRGFPIAVHDHTTLSASVQSVVFRVVSVIHCTAMWTPLRSVVSVNNLKRDTELFAVRSEKLSKLCIRNVVNLFVSFFAKLVFSSSNTKLFDGDRRIILFGKIYNFFCNLPASSLDKISLLVLKSLEIFLSLARALISMTLKFAFSFKISSLLFGNVFAKIELFGDFRRFGVKKGNCCKSGGADVYTNDKTSIVCWFRKFFFKDDSNLSVPLKGNVAEIPSIAKERVESLMLIVKFNRNCKALTRRISNLETWISSFRLNRFEQSFIESNGTPLKSIFNGLSLSPNVFSCFLDDIGM